MGLHRKSHLSDIKLNSVNSKTCHHCLYGTCFYVCLYKRKLPGDPMRDCPHTERGFVCVRYRCILSNVVQDTREPLLCSDSVLFVLKHGGFALCDL